MPTAIDLLSDPAHGLVREVRESQIQMARSVEEVLANGGVYVAEGPVGIGKTFAYLTPALTAAGRRVIVATAKKALQDQIEAKDLPTIAKHLGVVDGQAHALTTGPEGQRYYLGRVIKGKSNYTCRLLADKQKPLPSYYQWLQKSRFGDRADFPGAVPPWWPAATAEDCVGRACNHFGDCGYIKLKQDVTQTRVVVVNHHLLGSDMYYGLGKLVGGAYDVLIIDEAHKLADGIRAAYTLEVAEHSIEDLEKQLSDTPFAFRQHQVLKTVWAQMFAELPNKHWKESHTREAPVFPAHTDSALAGLANVDDELARLLRQYDIKGHPSEASFWEDFARVLEEMGDDGLRNDLVVVAMSRRKIDGMSQGIKLMQGQACKQQEDEEDEAWQERNQRMLSNTVIYGYGTKKGFHVEAAPIHVGGIARTYLSQVKSVIVTSATLAVDDKFDHLDEVIGVSPSKTEILPTSFNYEKQGLLFVPEDCPVVSRTDPTYGDTVSRRIDYCTELVNLSQGGAFILTTANDELDFIAEALRQRVQWPVFVQGHSKNPWDGDPPAVLAKYLATPNAVLVGSKSFWEGVDVQGEALRLVILSKLPFPNPQDPFVKARTAKYDDSYEGWLKVAYVDMMIDARQGVGRLIRSKLDLGVVAVLDSRIWTKPYGKKIRRGLQFPVTSDIEDCRYELPRIVAALRRRAQRLHAPKGQNVATP